MGRISVGPVDGSTRRIIFLWSGTPEDGENYSILSASVYFIGRVDWTPCYLSKEPKGVWIPPKDFRKMYKQAGAILEGLEKRVYKKNLERQRQAVPF